jgi:formate--tetrahydrofolate ligase
MPNLLRHVENITKVFGLPAVVAVNRFYTDTEAELALVEQQCKNLGVNVALSEVFLKGGAGGVALAEQVVRLCEGDSKLKLCYRDDQPLAQKIEAVANKIYRANGVEFAANAQKQLAKIEEMGFGRLPVCMAKTQYSFSDNASLPGAPEGFSITVRNVKVSAGAGFVVALTGDIMTMPGLPKKPSAENIDVDENGVIKGLF